MAKTLDEIKADIDVLKVTAPTGGQALKIYELIGDVVDTISTKTVPAPVPADLADLQRKLDEANGTINWQAGILQQTKDALGADDSVTMTQLPMFAKSIRVWAETGNHI